jgi:phenylalanyl-tRNA synthetase beta chain
MEKNVDPHLAEEVLYRGVQLYQELCNAEVASEVYDDFPGKRKPKTIQIAYQKIAEYLGLEIPAKKIKHILESLGCKVEMETIPEFGDIKVTPPTFRPDLEITADIIEEIARIYGYHNLPSKIMDTAIPLVKQEGVNFYLENKIKHFLADIGWQEVFTYSMVSEELAQQSGYSLTEHLKLQNPLTDDKVYLRRSLIPSLNEILDQNPNESQLSVFEIAHVYQPQAKGLPHELLLLSAVSSKGYREVKGETESLLERFFIKEVNFIENKPELEVQVLTNS